MFRETFSRMVTLYIININEIFQQSESVDYFFFFVLFFLFKFFCSVGFNFLIVFFIFFILLKVIIGKFFVFR